MKISHENKSMTIKLDKIPRLIYINEEGHGCGQIYLNGVRQKQLVKVKIKAQTDTGRPRFLQYYIDTYNSKKHTGVITSEHWDISDDLSVSISLTDVDIFDKLIDELKEIISNDSVPIDLKERIKTTIDKLNKNRR